MQSAGTLRWIKARAWESRGCWGNRWDGFESMIEIAVEDVAGSSAAVLVAEDQALGSGEWTCYSP